MDPGYENPDFKFKDKVKYHSVIIMLNVVMLNIIMLSSLTLSVVMLIAIMLNVVMLSVVAPPGYL